MQGTREIAPLSTKGKWKTCISEETCKHSHLQHTPCYCRSFLHINLLKCHCIWLCLLQWSFMAYS